MIDLIFWFVVVAAAAVVLILVRAIVVIEVGLLHDSGNRMTLVKMADYCAVSPLDSCACFVTAFVGGGKVSSRVYPGTSDQIHG